MQNPKFYRQINSTFWPSLKLTFILGVLERRYHSGINKGIFWWLWKISSHLKINDNKANAILEKTKGTGKKVFYSIRNLAKIYCLQP